MYRRLKIISLAIIAVLFTFNSQAQLTVTQGITADEALEILLGDGIEVSNVEYNGGTPQIGSFECNDCGIGMESGVILASGGVSGAEGPNDTGSVTEQSNNPGNNDPDLAQIESSIGDIAVLEFDFVATGDTVQFNYVWASDEYPEFVNSFNDAFAFFLSGPGLNGPYSNNGVNIAEIPGTNLAVTIDNLNNGNNGVSGPCVNCEYYIHNGTGGGGDPNGIQYDGYTVVLTASAQLQCGETYHIKIAIGDALDTAYDSAVFLEAGSFTSNATFIEGTGSIDPNTPAFLGDSTIIEGCNTGAFSVTRADCSMTDTVFFDILGSAENEVDFTGIPPFVVLDSGVCSIDIPVEAIDDSISESPESITLQYIYLDACGNADTTSATLAVVDYIPPVFNIEGASVACPGTETQLTANVSEGMGYYSYLWSTGAETASISVSPNQTTQYFAEVTDLCGTTVVDSFSVSVDYVPLEINEPAFEVLCPGDSVQISVEVENGSPEYFYDWESALIPDTSTYWVTPNPNEEINEYPVTVYDACGELVQTTVIVTVNNVNINPIQATPDTVCAGTGGSIQPVTGGTGSYTFGSDNPELTITENGTFTTSASMSPDTVLIGIIDECNNIGSITVVVEVCNTVIPNIFTPNGDDYNQTFFIDGIQGFPGSELIVYNRWGNIVFESSNYKNDWDGTNSSGEELSEGSYYYIFRRSDDQDFSGYIHLTR